MLGEPKNQFSLTRAALSTRGAQKQIPISFSVRKMAAFPCFLCLCLSSPAAETGILNGSFEDGLTGWTLGLKNATIYNYPDSSVASYPYPIDTIPIGRWNLFEDGVAGQYCAGRDLLVWNSYGWIGPDNLTYYIPTTSGVKATLSQTIHLSAGQAVTGWAKYELLHYADAYNLNGYASILVNGQTVWARWEDLSLPVISGDPEYWATYSAGWEQWRYDAPSDGQYTIEISLGGVVDEAGHYASARFDDIIVVPEPRLWSFSLLSAMLYGLKRLRILRG